MEKVLCEIGVRWAWFPTLVFAVHCVAFASDAYVTIPSLDVPMHAVGGVAIAYFLHHAVDAFEEGRFLQASRGALRVLLDFSLATTSAVLWEGVEYVANRALGRDVLMGREDTVADLFLGMFGAALYLAWKARRSRRNADGSR